MSKFTAKDKLSAVLRYLYGEETNAVIAESIGTQKSMVGVKLCNMRNTVQKRL